MSEEKGVSQTGTGGGGAVNPWTIQKLIQWTTDHFAKKNIPSARLDSELLLASVLKCARLDLYLKFDQPLKDQELKSFKELVLRRANKEPVAYILGQQEFYGRPFEVGPGALIPRPETEHLVDEAVKWASERFDNGGDQVTESVTVTVTEAVAESGSVSVSESVAEDGAKELVVALDIGSGSGCIATTLALEIPNAQLTAVEDSEEALKFINLNIKKHGMGERVVVRHCDFKAFAEKTASASFDLIISNPPYIAQTEAALLQKDVSGFEPHVALFGGEQGHEMIEAWLPLMTRLLKPQGLLLVEIGFDQGDLVQSLAKNIPGLKNVEILKDYSGHSRILKATGGETHG